MSAWAWWLVLGVLLGWLVEWVIDWVYWRQRLGVSSAAAASAREDLTTRQAMRERVRADSAQVTSEAVELREALAAARAESERLQAERDELRLAMQQEQRAVGELRSSVDALRAENAQLHRNADAATQDKRAHGTLHAFSVGAENRPLVQSHASAAGGASGEVGRLQPEPEKHRGDESDAIEATRDPLVDINGIGPVYEQRLFAAGITTFRALSTMSPAAVKEIIKPERWQEIHPETWIEEARLRAEGRWSKPS